MINPGSEFERQLFIITGHHYRLDGTLNNVVKKLEALIKYTFSAGVQMTAERWQTQQLVSLFRRKEMQMPYIQL